MIKGKVVQYKLLWIGNCRSQGKQVFSLIGKQTDGVIDIISRVSEGLILLRQRLEVLLFQLSKIITKCDVDGCYRGHFYYCFIRIVPSSGRRKLLVTSMDMLRQQKVLWDQDGGYDLGGGIRKQKEILNFVQQYTGK